VTSFDELAHALKEVVPHCKCADQTELCAKAATLFSRLYTFEDWDGITKGLNDEQRRAICGHFPLPAGKFLSIVLGRM